MCGNAEAASADGGARVWELAALWFLNTNRIHEALGLFWRLYQQMTVGQGDSGHTKECHSCG